MASFMSIFKINGNRECESISVSLPFHLHSIHLSSPNFSHYTAFLPSYFIISFHLTCISFLRFSCFVACFLLSSVPLLLANWPIYVFLPSSLSPFSFLLPSFLPSFFPSFPIFLSLAPSLFCSFLHGYKTQKYVFSQPLHQNRDIVRLNNNNYNVRIQPLD